MLIGKTSALIRVNSFLSQMEFNLISWIDFDSWTSDISCSQWSLAFPKTKTQQHQRLLRDTRSRGRRREAGNLRLWENDRNTEMETNRPRGRRWAKRRKQRSPVLTAKTEAACMAAETHRRLLHSDSCALISLHTMDTCQHSRASLALVQTNNLC